MFSRDRFPGTAPPGHVPEHSALAPKASAVNWEWLLPAVVVGLAAWFYFQ